MKYTVKGNSNAERGSKMGLLGKIKGIFGRQADVPENVYQPDWEEESLKRDNVDMHDKKQREHYVKACLEQLSEA